MICLFIFYVVPTQENFAMIVNSQYSYNNIVANLGNRWNASALQLQSSLVQFASRGKEREKERI